MKKTILVYFICYLIFGYTISPVMASSSECHTKSGFTIYDEKSNCCINPTANLKEDYTGRLSPNSIEATCNKKAGYTQIKDNKCYNTKTQLSYNITYEHAANSFQKANQAIYNEFYNFYLDEKFCGKNCDYDGKNCTIGFCNVNSCDKSAGYTQIKDEKCYNPKTQISYDQDKIFYKDNQKGIEQPCGKDCNIHGKNCKQGACYKENCSDNFILGQNSNSDLICHNKQTLIGYNYKNDFYYNGTICGKKCDLDGKNCEEGVCNVSNCFNKYTKYKDGYCINPSTGYFYTYNPKYNKNAPKHFKSEIEEFYFYYSDNAQNPTVSIKNNNYNRAECNKKGQNCELQKRKFLDCSFGSCSTAEDLAYIGYLGVCIIGLVAASPVLVPYYLIKSTIESKPNEVIVNYVEKNRH